jgi:hypothetical protein
MVKEFALGGSYSLRNVAFPSNTTLDDSVFIDDDFDEDDEFMSIITDLQQLFGSDLEIIRELQHRFDGLPIHSIVYYQSYNQRVLQYLIAAINMRRSKLDPTGNRRDCLGMTPLHILACSSVHDLEVYRLIVKRYPTNLITEDRWGALPLLYVFWGAAPAEVIDFLLERYQALYPDHVFNWTLMVETMGRCDTSKESIANLLHVKQMHFPEQPIDWGYLLDEFSQPSYYSFSGALLQDRMQFLVVCCLSERVEALAFKVWRDYITNMIHTSVFEVRGDNSAIMRLIQDKLAHFQDEVPKLKEATTILELALWKNRLDENGHTTTWCRKKMRTDESSIRSQNRVMCGADVIIGHVLPFLI